MPSAVALVAASAIAASNPGLAQASPTAPKPTSTAASPQAPDPHPQRGGIGPNGLAVGGLRLLSRGLVAPDGAAKLPTGLTARAFVLSDLDTGEVLAARDPHGRYQPASILKALTALVLLPALPGDRTVTASAAAAGTEGSAVGLVPGGKYSVDTLFKSLLLMSGNDAATALAEAAGGVPSTVAAMNAEVERLGGYDTVVQTPSGLDGWQQLTSAYDLSLILRAAVDNPRFVAYDRAPTASLPAQQVGVRKWGAVPLFNQSQDFLTGVPGALVAKSGYTDAALHTYLCAAQRGGRRLGVVFLRAQRKPTDQWQQAAALLSWGFALPKSTAAVGHLDPPVAGGGAGSTVAGSAKAGSASSTPTAGATPTTGEPTTAAPSAGPTASATRTAPVAQAAGVGPRPGNPTSHRQSVWTIINIALIAALAAVVGLKWRRRVVRSRATRRRT